MIRAEFISGKSTTGMLCGICMVFLVITGCGIEDTDEGPPLDDYDSGPVIISINPESGPTGTTVMITGIDFSPTPAENTVTFDGKPATVSSASDTLLETVVPDSATTGPVEVTARGQTAVGPTYTVAEQMPVISSLEPDSGTAGTGVLIHGQNFSPNPAENTVRFNGVMATVNSANDTLIDTQVPAGASTGPVDVTVNGNTATGPIFTVITTGTIEAVIATTGPDQDSDGYLLSLDGMAGRVTQVTDTLFFNDVNEGMHDLTLSDIAANCSVSGNNPRTVDVVAGDTAMTSFDVTCSDVIRNQIVFNTDRDGNNEIYVMNSDGSSQTPIISDAAEDIDPAVSPDGSQIAFSSDRDGNLEIYKVNADGSNLTQLTFTTTISNFGVAWSPDGSQIAFVRFTGAQNFEIFTMNADGSGETNITNNAADDLDPDWSPDGSQIAFSSDRDADGDPEVFVMNSDGSGVTQLTFNTIEVDRAPAWSPDGSQIAFQSNRLQSDNIFIMNADGSSQTQLTTSFSGDTVPDWSPDGLQVTFESDRDGNAEVYIINTDGSGVTNLTLNAAADSNPDWSQAN